MRVLYAGESGMMETCNPRLLGIGDQTIDRNPSM